MQNILDEFKNEIEKNDFFKQDELQIILRHLNQTKFVHK